MKWSDTLKIISNIAPTLATVAGGPLAGSAVSMLEQTLGVKPAANAALPARQDAVAAAVSSASPDTLLELKKADEAFQAQMASLGFANAEALEKLATDDRDSARKREIAVRDWTPKVLAVGVTCGFFGILVFMCVRAVPDQSRDLVNVMLGSLGAAWVSVIAYFFGSSAGNARQTELLAKAQPVTN